MLKKHLFVGTLLEFKLHDSKDLSISFTILSPEPSTLLHTYKTLNKHILNKKLNGISSSSTRILCLIYKFIFLFIYLFRLHWVFVPARRLSLVAASRDYFSLWCADVSLRWLLLLRSTGSRRAGFSSGIRAQ